MFASKFYIKTFKEDPQEASMISHKLMLRAGLIKKLGSGLYAWMPLGKRILNKVIKVVDKHMQNAGALEMMLPSIQSADLWQETGRWDEYGPTLLKMQDRHARDFCYAPTHEEVITALLREDINSYRQLPLIIYQINNKFRDEIRPRFGVMRAREFVMKDAYSFSGSEKELDLQYNLMFETYNNIFKELGLKFRAVEADSGNIGGKISHEFQALAQSGEDRIVFCKNSDYAANLEQAQVTASFNTPSAPTQSLNKVIVKNTSTIEKQAVAMQLESKQILKTLLVKGSSEANPIIALLLRGDHELNEIKASKHPLVASNFELIDSGSLKQTVGCTKGFIGPFNLDIPVIGDLAISEMSDFSCGANEEDTHYVGVNWNRDLVLPELFDLRNVVEGDLAPDGKNKLEITNGIEIGHIFQLGEKYSKAMQANFLAADGKAKNLVMGCYGIGISRIVAAAIEQNFDSKGIMWPAAIAPFHVVVIPIGFNKSEEVNLQANNIYNTLREMGIEVILDDRNVRPGIMFAEWELIGIPYQIVISEKTLTADSVEVSQRNNSIKELVKIKKLIDIIKI